MAVLLNKLALLGLFKTKIIRYKRLTQLGYWIVLTLEDAWIKAAIEHKALEITYRSEKDETTVRVVEPDYYGWSNNRRNFGCFGLCRLRGDIRCFKPENVIEWRYVDEEFSPNPLGRWQELLSVYEQKGLAEENF